MNRLLLTSLSLAISAPVMAFDRQHDSHEHGAATMLVAIEGDELQVRIESPAANLLGFEHAPASEQEKQKLKQTVEQLRNAANVVKLPENAKCSIEMASVEHSVGGETEDQDEEHGHDDHDHDEHKHEDHDHEEEHGSHSDFVLEYHFECGVPVALNQIDVKLFAQFPLLETLDLQYIAPQGQGGAELTTTNPVFRF